MNIYSTPVCILAVKLMLTFNALYLAFKSESFLCTGRKDLRVLDFVSLCNNWKGAMKLILIFFPKAQSAIVYFMCDRDNFKKKAI